MNGVTKYLDRITIDPEICHGKPCIRGMRWPVEVVLDMMLSEMSFDEILEDHPELEKQDLLASLEYAKMLVSGKTINLAA
jgi:uncharacterized protein (DUF433 family)